MSAGVHGNPNLYLAAQSCYITYAGTSESVTLPVGTKAVTLRPTTKCWIMVGNPGETAVSAAPGAEKTWVYRTFPINAEEELDIAVPPSTDSKLVQIAVIQDSSGGTLDIIARKE